MNQTSNRQLFDSFVEELLQERTARGLIIVGASKIDNQLVEILKTFLIAPNSSKEDDLLDFDKPLGTFSARIKSCFRLGLIDYSLLLDLDGIRKLRNDSAHVVNFDINKSPFRDRLRSLKDRVAVRRSFSLIQQRYLRAATPSRIVELQCILLSICLILEAVREKISVTTGNKSTLEISRR